MLMCMADQTWQRAARIMRRAAWGVTGVAVDRAAANIEGWLDTALTYGDDPGVTATPLPTFGALPAVTASSTKEQKQARNDAMRQQGEQLLTWWLTRMLSAQRPVVERLTFGWHQHWATSLTKVKSAPLMLRQNELLRHKGLGSVTDLTRSMVMDPALMIWLDAEKNTKAAPNENLARELMELFTLGVGGGYTETDVKQSARALSGWRVADDGTVTRDAKRSDPGPETVLGVTGSLTPEALVDAILASSAHPRYLATRWWHQLASAAAPSDEVLSRLVAAYGPGRDAKALFRAILADPAFVTATGTIVASPVDWVIGSMRTLAVPVTTDSVTQVRATLRGLGQLPLFPPNVSGWPSGASWLSTAAAHTRAAAALKMAKAANLSVVADAPTASRLDAVAHLLAVDHFSDRTRTALALAKGDPAQLVATALISPDYLVV
jgi:uncharacterized protein (DUF1800 family)